ncbi:MAG: hypothetical protein DRJ10_15740 [Bacteroidetes bacterium]|nr:MAG: hypothetical protein DRJ10_15740 [Bacteroidota bacterium]
MESYVGEVIHNTAESYTFDKEKGYTNKESNRAIFGAAEIYSNIPDLVKWINNFKTAKIGGKEVNDLFLKVFILNNGSNSEYALGISISSYRGLKRYRHTGGHEAFATQLSYFPEQDLGIITVSNFGGKGWLATSKIADLLLEEFMNAPTKKENQEFEIEKEKLKQFEGLYLASTFNNAMTLTIVEDTLTIDGKTKLVPISQNSFKIEEWNAQIHIENISKELTQIINDNGTRYKYSKTEKWTSNRGELKLYEGEYWSEELESVYHLIVKDKNLIIQHRWLGEITLEPIAKDFFKSGKGYYVKFNRNNDGDISNLSINSGRTLNVIFHRKE